MALNDLLSNVISTIRNGQSAGHKYVTVPSSGLVKSVLEVLRKEGYIESFQEYEQRKNIFMIKVDLKYYEGSPVIAVIKRGSTPGRRIYSKMKELKKFYGGLGVLIVSTSIGVLSDDEARKHKVGGEVLCYVY